jgi:probable HAF family extracellular repeat protein
MKPSVKLQEVHPAEDAAAVDRTSFEVVDLGPFDNNRNDVLALNDAGQCAGVSMNESTGRIEAFRQEDGKRTMLGTLGGSFSIARGINNRGEVVGGSLTEGDENFHAFLCRDQKLFDLNNFLAPDAGWEVIQALAINSSGEIVGIASQAGEDRVVLLRPRS